MEYLETSYIAKHIAILNKKKQKTIKQFRLVGLKYSSNDGRTYYAEEIGARSLPNINCCSYRKLSVDVGAFAYTRCRDLVISQRLDLFHHIGL